MAILWATPQRICVVDTTDNAKTALKARVAASHAYDRNQRPRTEIGKRVLYELLVKGFSLCISRYRPIAWLYCDT